METEVPIEGGMVVRGSGTKSMARFSQALVVALLALALGPLANADAAGPPVVTIASPAAGSSIAESAPLLAGQTSDESAADIVTVRIYEGSGTGGALVETLESGAPSGGAWSVASRALADGTYTAVAQQLDSETLETGVSGETTFTIDTVAPGVSLNAVATPTNDPTPTFTGSPGGALGDEPVVTVSVYAGASATGTPLETGQASIGGGKWSYTSGALADGTYTVIATQRDEAGNVGTAGPQTFVVDTTAPLVSLDTGAVAPLTNDATPSFSGSGGEAPGDAATVLVVVHKGSSVTGAVALEGSAAVTNGAWSFTSPHLVDGTYTVQAIQRDAAGNEGRSATATFRIDTTPPVLTMSSPKSHETLTSSSRPTFSGTTNNGTGEPTAVTIEIFAGESTAESHLDERLSVERSGSSWTTGSAGPRLSNGLYTVRARELDAAGNLGESSPVAFSVKTPSPAVTLAALPHWTSNATPSFAGTADTFEAKPEVTIKIWRGTSASGEVAETIDTAESGGAWTATAAKALPEGTYTAQAEQASEAANPPGVSDTTTFIVDTTAPKVTLSAPSTSTGIETVSGAAGTEAGDRRQITVELFSSSAVEPGNALETIVVNATGDAWSATFADLAAGEYTVLARQSDEAGNVGESAPNAFTVSAPPPVTPPAQSPTPGAAAPSPPSASFTWVPSNPTVGESVSLVSSSTNGSSAIGSYAWDLAGSGQFVPGGAVMTTSFATTGAHVVQLQVTDVDGLSSMVAQTIVVTAAPLRLMQPFPIVRIAGAETSYGAKVSLLTVQAPIGATVRVTCAGHGCATKSESRVAAASSKATAPSGAVSLTFKRFERALRAGVTLQIRVTKAGEIGKFTSFAIRREKLPVRTDACLLSASTKPSACPST